jgi:cytochrome c oxidase subunit III
MATLTPTFKEPRTSHGGGSGGPIDRFPGGGGGGGRGDQNHDFGERLRRYRLGVTIGLVGIFMLFLSFTVAFLLHEKFGVPDPHTNTYVRNWKPIWVPTDLLLFNTCLLVISSFTLEKARRQAFQQAAVSVAAVIPGVKWPGEHRLPWLAATIALSFGFLAGQLAAWRELMARGIYMKDTPSSSFFYVLTAMHAVHLFGGILALLYAGFAVHRRQGLERRRVALDVTALYWHSMTILWLYILVLLVIVR